MRRVFLTLAFLLFTVQAWGSDQNIYIDSSAAAGGSGSIESPYDAFSDINWTTGGSNSIYDWVAADDDVFINLTGTFESQLVVRASGVSGHPITIQGYGTTAIIDGTETVASPLLLYDGSNPVDYITVKNIAITGATQQNIGPDNSTPDNIILDGVVSYGSLKHGADIQLTNSTIQNCVFKNNLNGGLYIDLGTTVTVINCEAYGNGITGENNHDGFNLANITGLTVTNCRSYNNKSSAGSGIDLNGSTGTASNNYIYSNEGKGINTTGSCDIDITKNVIVNNAGNGLICYESDGVTDFYNNTIVSPAGTNVIRVGLSDDTLNQTVNLRNNVLVGGDYSIYYVTAHATLTSDYNNFYSAGTTHSIINAVEKSFADWKTDTSQDANSIITNPRLLPSGKLRTGSPAKLAGVEIAGVNDTGTDRWGNSSYRLNIGAYWGPGIYSGILDIGKGYGMLRIGR